MNLIFDKRYIFFSSCLDFIIKKLVTKAKEKIDEVEKEAKNLKSLHQSREEIISFLNNLYENMSNLDSVSEPIIDTEKLNEFVNKEMEYPEPKKVDLNKIRKNLEKLVKIELDWTESKRCKLTTYAFINQNNL